MKNHARKKRSKGAHRLACLAVLAYIVIALSGLSLAGTKFIVIPFLEAANRGAVWADTLIWVGVVGVLVLLSGKTIRR
jgi:hypothetical protein